MPFPMPCNIKTKGFLHYYKGALVFCSQKPRFRKKIGQLAVQIIDAQSLQIVEKIVNNSSHGVEILTTSSLAAGKDLTLTEACNAVASNDDPYRWIILEKNKHCWGLFFAGGGLGLCRDQLKRDKNRSYSRPRQQMKLLHRWLIKLLSLAFGGPASDQQVNNQTFDKKVLPINPPAAPNPSQVTNDLVIPIHQSLKNQRVTVDLPDNLITALDELGTMLGKTREESLKHLLRLVLLE